MNTYQPHGKHPSAITKCAIWGSMLDDRRGWRSMLVFQNFEMASTFDRNIRNQVRKPINAINSATGPPSHWLDLVRIVYRIGFIDSRLALRNIKYQNAAKPKAGWANACLLYIHHIESFQIACDNLRKEASEFPSAWCTSPEWAKQTADQSQVLDSEIKIVYKGTQAIRIMILQQLDLKQKATATILTILASLFLPTSLVGTFFSMNTVEINKNHGWPIKYYFISAAPFTVITIVLPVIFLPSYYFLVRKWNTCTTLQKRINWISIGGRLRVGRAMEDERGKRIEATRRQKRGEGNNLGLKVKRAREEHLIVLLESKISAIQVFWDRGNEVNGNSKNLRILGSRLHFGRHKFKVQLLGHPADNMFYDSSGFTHAEEDVEVFHAAYPDRPSPEDVKNWRRKKRKTA
ncbi:hypothetical protein NHQ30_004472 [Ciborinia camelliae]|nr:hypothetical protein NHQ30_004472 [Ciborinia camelliae]